MAVDKSAIIDAIYEGAAVAAYNPVPPTLWSHNDDIAAYLYDPVGAYALMLEAGLEEGFETDLWYTACQPAI